MYCELKIYAYCQDPKEGLHIFFLQPDWKDEYNNLYELKQYLVSNLNGYTAVFVFDVESLTPQQSNELEAFCEKKGLSLLCGSSELIGYTFAVDRYEGALVELKLLTKYSSQHEPCEYVGLFAHHAESAERMPELISHRLLTGLVSVLCTGSRMPVDADIKGSLEHLNVSNYIDNPEFAIQELAAKAGLINQDR